MGTPKRGPMFWSRDNLVRFTDTHTKHGRVQSIIQNTHKILDWKLQSDTEWTPSSADRTALIIADTETSPVLYNVVAGVLPQYDLEPTIMLTPQRSHPNAPLDEPVVAAIERSDLIINMATYTITHSPSVVQARKDGTSYILLANPTEDTMSRGAVDADPRFVDDLTTKITNILEEGSWVEVTSPRGTDIEFSLEESTEFHNVGYPMGEANTLPLPMEKINGTIVHDSFLMMVGILEEPIVMEVEEGWVVSIEGGLEAEQLKWILEHHDDENSNAFAEFSIMTNPEARPNGNLIEHKQVGGGTHMAIGNNTSHDGPVSSSIHLDGVQLEPTIKIDGETILQDGKFQIEL